MAKPITMTYSLAMAAAQDAGNRSMRAGGRTKWAVKDWNVACETFARLWPSPTPKNVSESDSAQRTAIPAAVDTAI